MRDRYTDVLDLIQNHINDPRLIDCFNANLTQNERDVLYLRYVDANYSQAHVAQSLKITQGRVSSLEDSALRKLQHPSVKTDYLK